MGNLWYRVERGILALSRWVTKPLWSWLVTREATQNLLLWTAFVLVSGVLSKHSPLDTDAPKLVVVGLAIYTAAAAAWAHTTRKRELCSTSDARMAHVRAYEKNIAFLRRVFGGRWKFVAALLSSPLAMVVGVVTSGAARDVAFAAALVFVPVTLWYTVAAVAVKMAYDEMVSNRWKRLQYARDVRRAAREEQRRKDRAARAATFRIVG